VDDYIGHVGPRHDDQRELSRLPRCKGVAFLGREEKEARRWGWGRRLRRWLLRLSLPLGLRSGLLLGLGGWFLLGFWLGLRLLGLFLWLWLGLGLWLRLGLIGLFLWLGLGLLGLGFWLRRLGWLLRLRLWLWLRLRLGLFRLLLRLRGRLGLFGLRLAFLRDRCFDGGGIDALRRLGWGDARRQAEGHTGC
jgi:hypothetical protein